MIGPKKINLSTFKEKIQDYPCVKSVRIRSYSGPYAVLMRENMDQNNSEYENLSRSGLDFLKSILYGLSSQKIVKQFSRFSTLKNLFICGELHIAAFKLYR